MPRAFAEISFTPSLLALQAQNGSAQGYSKFLHPDAERGDRIGPAEAEFIARRDGFYQATVSDSGWPYVQFRGGPVGFLKVLDDQTIAYADFRGNRQYLSAGNLTDNDRVSMILMDYPNRRRLKVWGRAKLIAATENPELIAQLQDTSYRGRIERAIVIAIEALDWNCPQHIPQRMTLEELESQLEPIRADLSRLKSENKELKLALGQTD
ncbi:pyridoxamine 5'-phosphate oxidase family protein [Tateyamaria sp. Alg231-49]|uniref:pyridoxamine 5'-phosphate oxidase family protein n=1 Tax=Tateyamaria sp. Alg231-49 TaxID=1922219 RepID=UPI000D553D39|nr:pyridoxamine 5'-phosphate oxidase family protein [Tateyamaria sp. Alg231-49]